MNLSDINPSTRLKWASVFFAVFWTAGMAWMSEERHPVEIAMLLPCGAAVGYGWYRAMRWQIPRGRVPARRGNKAA